MVRQRGKNVVAGDAQRRAGASSAQGTLWLSVAWGRKLTHVWLAPIGPYSPHLPESSPLKRDARSDKSSLSESLEAQGGIDLFFLHGAAAAYCAGGTQL